MSLNSKVSKVIFVYNEIGKFVKGYSSILSVAAITNINRLVISRKLKNMNLNLYFYLIKIILINLFLVIHHLVN